MDALLDSLLPYLDSASFSYIPTVGLEDTSLDLYYNHGMHVGYISVDSGRLYLNIRVMLTESFEDSFPSYYNDLDKFLHRFSLKHVLKLKEWDNTYQQVYEIFGSNVVLIKYLDFLDSYKYCRTTASAKQSVEILRKLYDEFG